MEEGCASMTDGPKTLPPQPQAPSSDQQQGREDSPNTSGGGSSSSSTNSLNGGSSSRGGDSVEFSLDSASFDSGTSSSFDSADDGGSSVSFDSTDGGGAEAEERELMRRKRISDANSGKTPWNKGRKHSPETIAKIKERTKEAMNRPEVLVKTQAYANQMLTTKRSEETKAGMRTNRVHPHSDSLPCPSVPKPACRPLRRTGRDPPPALPPRSLRTPTPAPP
ncbi:MAG: hypothetical protein WDW38_000581 [Sanguina aurantia]